MTESRLHHDDIPGPGLTGDFTHIVLPYPVPDGIASLDIRHPLGDVPPQRWATFVSAANRFVKNGGFAKAIDLGWLPKQLFGCDRTKPGVRVDRMGLLWFCGGNIASLHEDHAVLNAATGVTQTYRRQPTDDDVVMPWELSDPKEIKSPP